MTDRHESVSRLERERYNEEVDRLFEAADALMASNKAGDETEDPSTEVSPEKQRFRDVFRRVSTISQVLRLLDDYRREQEHAKQSGQTGDLTAGETVQPLDEDHELLTEVEATLALKSGSWR